MPTTGGYTDPLTFAAICLLIYGILSMLTGLLLSRVGYMNDMYGGMFRDMYGGMFRDMYGLGEFSSSMIILYVIIIPILSIIILIINAAILNFIYKGLGGTGNYEGTLRFTSYENAVNIIAWIPIVGWIIGLYGLYLQIVGGRYVHNVSMWKSAIAMFLDVILIGILGFAIGAVAMIGIFGL